MPKNVYNYHLFQTIIKNIRSILPMSKYVQKKI